jgi:sarcosine oxidase
VLARRAVVTVGAWTSALLEGLVTLPRLRVTREQAAYFRLVGVHPCMPREADWPTFIHHIGDGAGDDSGIYGLSDPCGDVTVGLRGPGPECDPDRHALPPEPARLGRLKEYVAEWLPGLDHTRPDPISRTPTVTRDSGPVLERTGPLVVGAGLSCHGFALAPALGRVLADLATGAMDLSAVR